MQNILVSILFFFNILAGNQGEKYENDKRIYGKWKVTEVKLQDSPNGDFKKHLDKQNITMDSANRVAKSYFGRLAFKFEEDNDLIIFNSPEQIEPVYGQYRMQKTANRDEVKLEIAGSKVLTGKLGVPYQLIFINDQKIDLVSSEGTVQLIFKLIKEK